MHFLLASLIRKNFQKIVQPCSVCFHFVFVFYKHSHLSFYLRNKAMTNRAFFELHRITDVINILK